MEERNVVRRDDGGGKKYLCEDMETGTGQDGCRLSSGENKMFYLRNLLGFEVAKL